MSKSNGRPGVGKRARAKSASVDERLFLQSVARALDVLEAYADNPKPKSLGEIAASAGVNKSAAQRIGQTLLSRGYLERAEDGGLAIGYRLLDRSFDYLRSNSLIERATPILMDLRRMAGECVDLSLFDDTSTLYAIRLQSKRETFYATLTGSRRPAPSRACRSSARGSAPRPRDSRARGKPYAEHLKPGLLALLVPDAAARALMAPAATSCGTTSSWKCRRRSGSTNC